MIALGLAWRNLSRAPQRTVFAIAMSFVGVLAAVLVAGYMVRTFLAIQESTIRGGVAHLQIGHELSFDGYEERPLEHGLRSEDVVALREVLQEQSEVRLVLPRLSFFGLASVGERSLPFTGTGVDPRQERRLAGSFNQIEEGVGLERGDENDAYRVVVGAEMARLLGVRINDPITLMSVTTTGGLNAVDATVVGFARTGQPQVDRMLLLAPISLAQDLLRTDRLTRIAIGLEETSQTAPVRAALAVRAPNLAVRTWRELAPLYNQLRQLYANQFSVLGAVFALLVMLTIANMTALSVAERTRDIGAMRAIGLPASLIRGVFAFEGALSCLAGGLLGVLGAAGLTPLINSAEIMMPPPPNSSRGYALGVTFPPTIALLIVLSTIAMGALAAFLASGRVARIGVMDALRSS